MRKVIYFIICLLLFLGISNVKAYETDSYSVNIPKDFTKDNAKDFWQKESNDDTITITINVHKNTSGLNFEDYKEEDLKEENYIEELKENFKELQENIKIESTNIEFITVNNIKAIRMDVISNFTSRENYNSLVYQTQYTIASKNYVYYIVISTSNKDNLDSLDIKEMVNSFTIKDYLAKKDESLTKYYLFIAIIIALGVFVLVLYKRKNN